MMAQKVREVMTSQTVTLAPGTSLVDAARRMRDQDVGDVLVAEGDRLHGIVTDRDIVVRALAEGREGATTTIGDVCSGDLTVVAPDDDADKVVRLMRSRAVRRVPVVEDGRVVGVVSIGDMAIERDPKSALADISAARENT
jgi:CBS domain-containing protein